jgi:hypothetical protein
MISVDVASAVIKSDFDNGVERAQLVPVHFTLRLTNLKLL